MCVAKRIKTHFSVLLRSISLNSCEILQCGSCKWHFLCMETIKIKSFPSFAQHRYLFEVKGQEPSNLCNQWLEWEATDLQVKSVSPVAFKISDGLHWKKWQWRSSVFSFITILPFRLYSQHCCRLSIRQCSREKSQKCPSSSRRHSATWNKAWAKGRWRI